MMPTIRAIVVFNLLWIGATASAEVFKCVDANGKITYSSQKEPQSKCTPVTAEITVVPAVKVTPPPAKAEDPKAAKREDLQKRITEQEASLAEAKKQLAEQEELRVFNEIPYQKRLDRLKPYQDRVADLEKGLAQLQEELRQAK